jgi:hypothetical protein
MNIGKEWRSIISGLDEHTPGGKGEAIYSTGRLRRRFVSGCEKEEVHRALSSYRAVAIEYPV